MLLNYSSIRSRSRKKDKFFQIQVIVSISQADIITQAALKQRVPGPFVIPSKHIKHAKAKPDIVVKRIKIVGMDFGKMLKVLTVHRFYIAIDIKFTTTARFIHVTDFAEHRPFAPRPVMHSPY